MKNILFIYFFIFSFFSFSQIQETENQDRWEVIGSNKNGSVLLKLEGNNLYNFSFRNYLFSDKQIIQSLYLNSSDSDISNLYRFLFNSFDLNESSQSSFKIDKYKFEVFKKNNELMINICSINSNEKIGLLILSIKDLNNLFGSY